MNIEAQIKNFKNHIATLTKYDNLTVLDFNNPETYHYRIRFIFEEDYCKLHISGDLGELIATNYYNMTFKKFFDFVNNTGYFEEKIDCHSRNIYYYDIELAKEQLKKFILDFDLLSLYEAYYYDTEEERLSALLSDILVDFSDETGISQEGLKLLTELDNDAYELAGSLGKKETGILDLYMLAFKLAMKQLDGVEINETLDR